MKKIFLSLLVTVSLTVCAQQGKDGSPTINASTIVNSYTTLSVDVSAGASSITVAAVAGLAGGSINTLSAGDLIMIIQMQGAVTNVASPSAPWFDPNSSGPYDNTYGAITSYDNAGNNELAEINSISGTTLTLNCQLKNSYSVSGKTQIVRVPRYTSLTISATGTITCPQWMRENGYGGVISIEVHGNTNIAAGGKIDASGLGFRGGAFWWDGVSVFGSDSWGTTTNRDQAAYKGESVAGDSVVYSALQAKFGKGAIANGGGGGCAVNAGGGGGSNAGTTAWTGTGNPDASTADYVTCWNRETAGFATSTSSGGGRGGYTYANTNSDPRLFGPNSNTNWAGDSRRNLGGFGGRPLDYSSGRLFLGGGGGSGDGDNYYQGGGGNGGGIIYLLSYGTVSGGGQINTNGANGENTYVGGARGSDNAFSLWGRDGAGGAGGGGAVVVNSTGAISGIAINAKGGVGGNQQMINNGASSRNAYGPGGGGGGGYIGVNTGATSTNDVSGGWNGIVTYLGTANGTMIDGVFPANGSTKGGAGEIATTVTNFSITTSGATICSGTTAVLSATLNGTTPNPITINWYSDAVGGSPIASGTSYTTTTLTSDVTYYVGTCPGTYREPVTVTVSPAPAAPLVSNESYCQNEAATDLSANATAGAGNTLVWWGTDASGGTPTATAPTPLTSGTGQTIYYVSQTNGSCDGPRQAITVDVVALPNAPTTAAISYCQDEAATNLTATAGGGTTLLWWGTDASGGSSTPVTGPVPSTSVVGPTTYYVSATNGSCESQRSPLVVTVNALPAPPSVNDTINYCQNEAATQLSPNGAGINWYTSATGGTAGAAPTPNTSAVGVTTYYVSQTQSSCESLRDSIKVVVNTGFSAPAASDVTLCFGSTATALSPNGAGYNWYTSASGGTASSSVTPSTGTVAVTSYYVSQGNGTCESARTQVDVTIQALPGAPALTGNLEVCEGNSTTLSVTSPTETYNWYTTPSGGTSFFTGDTYTTPVLNDTTSYYIETFDGLCSSVRNWVRVNVNPVPNPPTVADSVSYCQNETATQLTPNGAGINWYTSATGGTAGAAPTPNTSTTGTTTYYVSQTQNACESLRDSIKVVVNTSFAAPSATDTSYCVGATAVPVNATGTGTLNWYTVSSGGTSIPQPTPSTATATLLTYYVSQGTGSCESAREQVDITINAIPIPPAGNDVSYCLNDAAVPLTTTGGTNLLWYTSLTGGTGNATAPTPLTSSATPVSYFVSQTVNGCESNRDEVVVTTNAIPSPPTVSDTVSYCQNETASQLSPNGAGINWYSDASGTLNITAPTPNTGTIGVTTYYVSQTQNACESVLDSVKVVINTTYAPPTASDESYCVGETATPVSATGTGTLNWYTVASGGTTIPQPTPSTASATILTYYVSQGSGSCESAREQVDITINAVPSAPVGNDVNYCINETASPLSATGVGTINWYVVPFGGTASASAPTPSTATIGSTDYYVSQTIGTCESQRDVVTVTVVSLQNAPATSNVNYCTGSTATALTATGTSTLNWWGTSATGGTSSSSAPIPSTTATGTTTYYVSQGSGACESSRAAIDVVVYANPTISFTQNTNAVCANACVQFTESASATCASLAWDFGDGNTSTGSNPTNCYSNAGVYTVTVVCTSTQGCTGASVVNNAVVVSPGAQAQISVNPGTIVSVGTDVSFAADTGLAQTAYSWSFADPASGTANSSSLYNPSHTFDNVGTYCVTLIAGVSPCTDDESVCVEVIKEAFITIPNVFTPNNDGLNDLFSVSSSGITSLEGSIFDRWGLKIFSWNGVTSSWDGKSKTGATASDGVYYYIIQATDYKNETKTYTGYTQLLAK